MKKYLLLVLLFLMFIPLLVNAETCDTNKITIENISIVNKTDDVEEIEEATTIGKKININLSLSELGDNIKYRFVVKNNSKEDYVFDSTSLNLNSKYINYSFETDDNSNIVKANSSKYITLKIEYKNEVSENKFTNGSYNDNKTITVQLSNGDKIEVTNTLKNPNTGIKSYIIIFLIILLISGILYIVLKKKQYTIFMIIITGTMIIIPMSVYALCKYEIKIESTIKIEKKHSVYYVYPDWLSQDEVNTLDYHDIKRFDEFCADENNWCMLSNIPVTYGEYTLYMITVKDSDYKENKIVQMKDYRSRFEFGYNNINLDSPNLISDHYGTNWLYMGDYEEIDKMNFIVNENFLGVFYNDQDKPYMPFALLNLPQKFTMPSHNVYFYTFVGG